MHPTLLTTLPDFDPSHDLVITRAASSWSSRYIANPRTINWDTPALSTILSAMHTLRSSPAEPGVSYSGKGIEDPIKGLIILIFISFKI